MFPTHKYVITRDKITIYPLHFVLFLAISLFVVLFILSFSIMIFIGSVAGNLDFPKLFLNFILFCLILSPFFIASQIKISIDLKTGEVYKHYLVFKHKLINLKQVDKITKIGSSSGGYYSLIPKSNTYSKGYKISSNYAEKDAKELADFQKNVLTVLESKLIPTEHKVDDSILDKLMYYNQHGYIFTVKPHHKIYQYAMLAIIIGLWIWILFFAHDFQTWVWFTILPAMIYVYSISQRRYIDIQEKCIIESSLWLLLAQKYSLNNFTGFLIEHGGRNPYAEGTVVYMKFTSEKGEKQVVLRDFGRSKQVEEFMNETKAILHKTLNN